MRRNTLIFGLILLGLVVGFMLYEQNKLEKKTEFDFERNRWLHIVETEFWRCQEPGLEPGQKEICQNLCAENKLRYCETYDCHTELGDFCLQPEHRDFVCCKLQ